jgi:uncharacterized membrane protein
MSDPVTGKIAKERMVTTFVTNLRGRAAMKVFLYDLSNLTGIWRAFSFIGLGVVLVGIGHLYQRLLFRRAAPAQSANEPADTAPS